MAAEIPLVRSDATAGLSIGRDQWPARDFKLGAASPTSGERGRGGYRGIRASNQLSDMLQGSSLSADRPGWAEIAERASSVTLQP